MGVMQSQMVQGVLALKCILQVITPCAEEVWPSTSTLVIPLAIDSSLVAPLSLPATQSSMQLTYAHIGKRNLCQ